LIAAIDARGIAARAQMLRTPGGVRLSDGRARCIPAFLIFKRESNLADLL
jgi:hypothetical protein